jgi:hypothetical protein
MLRYAVLSLLFAGLAHAESCVPPSGFIDQPHPEIAPVKDLVSHTEEVIDPRSLQHVLDDTQNRSLKDAIKKGGSLPTVAGTYPLTEIEFGQPGARRLVCLTDGSTTEEQVLENERTETMARFRYVVWNYTTDKARPIRYGVGEFVRTQLEDGRTKVVWTYSFALNRSRFPGFLGGLGDYLFRVGFLERDYAEMMRSTLKPRD